MNAINDRVIRASLAILVCALFALVVVEAVRQQVGPWLWVSCAGAAYLIIFGWTAVHARSSAKQQNWKWRLAESLAWFGGMLIVAILLNGGVGTAIKIGPIDGHGVVFGMMLATLAASLCVVFVLRTGPPLVWITLGILGAYAFGSLILLLVEGRPVGATFGGEAFWRALPVSLQGPAVGLGFVVATSVLLVAHGVKREGRTSWVDAISLAVPAVAFVGILVLTAPNELSPSSAVSGAPRQSTPVESLPALSIETDSVLVVGDAMSRMLDLANRYGPADYDIPTLAERLGEDPDSAFVYVRDNIALEPYAGVLRGAEGALSARAGNSFDRALLLRAILDQQGHSTRLAVGQLDAESVIRLRSHVLSREPTASTEEPIIVLAGLRGAALDRFRARVERDQAWLAHALRDHMPGRKPEDESEIDPNRHVWVQIQGEEGWVDLDTSLPQNEPGTLLATLAATMNSPEVSANHSISIRVVAESVSASGALASETLLETDITAEEASRSHVFLAFLPNLSNQSLGGIVSASVLRESEYHPVLLVGDEIIEGETIPTVGRADADSSSGETAQEFFFGGGGDDSAPRLSALYLEVVVNSPDRESVVKRRPLVDRLSSGQRERQTVSFEDLSSVETADGMPVPFTAIHQIVTSTGGANPFQGALGMASALDFAAQNMSTPEDAASLSLQEALWPLAELNSQIALASERLSIPLLNDHRAIRFFADAPRVFVVSLRPYPQAGENGVRFEIDLIHDGVGWIAGDNVEAAEITGRRLRYGIAQSALETTMMELRALALEPGTQHVVSASTGLTADWSVLSSSQIGRRAAQLPHALIADAEDGLAIVAPAAADDQNLETWWAFDRSNGATTARLAPSLGGIYVNGSTGGPRIILDERTARTLGEVRNGVDRYYRRGSPKGSCRGGEEYTTILGCVSIPSSVATGILVAFNVAIYTIIASQLIRAFS